MPQAHNGIQYRELGPEGIVYPGHPVAIAYLIMLEYASLAAAVARGRQHPSALENGGIPGAGSHVYAALWALKRGESLGADAALEYGDEYWRNNVADNVFSNCRERGQHQADCIRQKFREVFATWKMQETQLATS